MKKIREIKTVVNQLPEKKRYAEFVTAVLSVPVLITVLMLNLNSLKKSPSAETSQANAVHTTTSASVAPTLAQQETPSARKITHQNTPTVHVTPSPTPLNQTCMKEVGPVTLVAPEENTIVTQNPIAIDIKRDATNYCEIVWAYRINNDPWSEYLDKSIYLYNLSPGKKTIEVKVKSIASSNQTILTRSFVIPAPPSPSPASSSATLQ